MDRAPFSTPRLRIAAGFTSSGQVLQTLVFWILPTKTPFLTCGNGTLRGAGSVVGALRGPAIACLGVDQHGAAWWGAALCSGGAVFHGFPMNGGHQMQ